MPIEDPDWLARSSKAVQQMYSYWRSKCDGDRLPSRGAIEPAEIKRFLPQITIVEVVSDERRYVYRLVGTMEVEIRGRDPTGKSVGEGFYGASAEASMASYHDVVARRALRLERREFTTPDGRYGREQVILLPLSNDGAHVNMIIVYTHYMLH